MHLYYTTVQPCTRLIRSVWRVANITLSPILQPNDFTDLDNLTNSSLGTETHYSGHKSLSIQQMSIPTSKQMVHCWLVLISNPQRWKCMFSDICSRIASSLLSLSPSDHHSPTTSLCHTAIPDQSRTQTSFHDGKKLRLARIRTKQITNSCNSLHDLNLTGKQRTIWRLRKTSAEAVPHGFLCWTQNWDPPQ